MAQRHQVYLKVKDRVYGIHHSWLFGHTAIRLLRNLLKFSEGTTAKHQLEQGKPSEILKRIYSMDAEKGYFHEGIGLLDNETKDPRLGDNNNGITIIDLSNIEKPKFCFMSLDGLQTMHDSVLHPHDIVDDQELSYQNFTPIDASHWMQLHYGKNWRVEWRDSGDAEDLERMKEVSEWIDYLDSFDLLRVQDCAEIFPDMVTDKKGDGLYVKENSIMFMLDEKAFSLKSTTKTKKKVRKKRKAQPSKVPATSRNNYASAS